MRLLIDSFSKKTIPKFTLLTKTPLFSLHPGQEPAAPKGLGLGLSVQQKQQELVKSTEVVVPKEPPPEFEFVADPPSISAFDL